MVACFLPNTKCFLRTTERGVGDAQAKLLGKFQREGNDDGTISIVWQHTLSHELDQTLFSTLYHVIFSAIYEALLFLLVYKQRYRGTNDCLNSSRFDH